jgi:outer membrane protein
MRFDKVIVVLAAVTLLVWGLGASNKGIKIGVFDMDRALTASKQGRAALEKLERKVLDAEAQLAPLGERLAEIRKELEDKKYVLSQEAREERRRDALDVQNRLDAKKKELEVQVQLDRERELSPLLKNLGEVVQAYGREEGFSLILVRNNMFLAYAREALDVTDEIIEQLDSKG